MKTIVVFGPGCTNCVNLATNAEQAAKELGIEYQLEKVKDLAQIARFGIMRTPALSVDGSVKTMGKVASVEEIKALLQ